MTYHTVKQFIFQLIGNSGCCSSVSVVSYGLGLKYKSYSMGIYKSVIEDDNMIGYRSTRGNRYLHYSRKLHYWMV